MINIQVGIKVGKLKSKIVPFQKMIAKIACKLNHLMNPKLLKRRRCLLAENPKVVVKVKKERNKVLIQVDTAQRRDINTLIESTIEIQIVQTLLGHTFNIGITQVDIIKDHLLESIQGIISIDTMVIKMTIIKREVQAEVEVPLNIITEVVEMRGVLHEEDLVVEILIINLTTIIMIETLVVTIRESIMIASIKADLIIQNPLIFITMISIPRENPYQVVLMISAEVKVEIIIGPPSTQHHPHPIIITITIEVILGDAQNQHIILGAGRYMTHITSTLATILVALGTEMEAAIKILTIV